MKRAGEYRTTLLSFALASSLLKLQLKKSLWLFVGGDEEKLMVGRRNVLLIC